MICFSFHHRLDCESIFIFIRNSSRNTVLLLSSSCTHHSIFFRHFFHWSKIQRYFLERIPPVLYIEYGFFSIRFSFYLYMEMRQSIAHAYNWMWKRNQLTIRIIVVWFWFNDFAHFHPTLDRIAFFSMRRCWFSIICFLIFTKPRAVTRKNQINQWNLHRVNRFVRFKCLHNCHVPTSKFIEQINCEFDKIWVQLADDGKKWPLCENRFFKWATDAKLWIASGKSN